MKLRNLQHLSGAAVAAVALTFVPAVLATTQADQSSNSSSQSPSSSGGARLQVATPADMNAEAKNFDDARVRSSDGKDLGKIRDFLVNPKSGQVSCAVISSGGWAGIGAKLRVVPFSALQPAAESSAAADAKGTRAFQMAITQAQWQQVPTITEDQFEHGRVPMTAQMRQQLAQTFQAQMQPSAAESGSEMTLMRVRKIRGQDLQANGEDIGRIEGVLIRPGQTEALAVVNPKADFAGGEQKYLVPLTAIDVMGSSGNAQTQLTRQDFRSAQMSQTTAAMPSPANAAPNASSRQLSSNAGADATSGAAAPTAVTPTGSASGFQSPDTAANSGNAAATTSTTSTSSTDNASQVKKD